MRKFLTKTSALIVSAIMAASLAWMPVMAEEGDVVADATEVEVVADFTETEVAEDAIEDEELYSYLDEISNTFGEDSIDMTFGNVNEVLEATEDDEEANEEALGASVVSNIEKIKTYVKENGEYKTTYYYYEIAMDSNNCLAFWYTPSSNRLQINLCTLSPSREKYYEGGFIINCADGVIYKNTAQVWYRPIATKVSKVSGRTQAFNNAAYKSNTTLTDFKEYLNTTGTTFDNNELSDIYNLQIHRCVSALNTFLSKKLSMKVTDIGFTSYSEPSKSKVQAFVKRIYTDCLNRTPEADGVLYWTEQLMYGKRDGASVGAGFVFSDEYWSKGVTRKEYVKMLYKVFMGREADEAGLNYWLDNMANGMTREQVFKGFVESNEYTTICQKCGISRGNYKVRGVADPKVANKKVTSSTKKFVERIYVKALGRAADASGVKYWSQEIANENRTPVSVAKTFIFSTEFTSKNYSNKEYIKILYRTFMGREADSDGLNYWLKRMKNGDSRETVLDAMAASDEFKQIIKSFGL